MNILEAEVEIVKLVKRVFNLAYNFTGNREDAEDLTQEATIKMLSAIRRENFDLNRPLKPYFIRIIRTIYFDYLKKRKKYRFVSLDDEDTAFLVESDTSRPGLMHFNPEQIFEKELLKNEVRVALSQLPDKFRLPLVLADKEDLSYEEIGKVLCCPVGTVRSRIHRARKMLAEYLVNEE
jgi:RNA polymerase sigma-70 factor (ECF subfamily)